MTNYYFFFDYRILQFWFNYLNYFPLSFAFWAETFEYKLRAIVIFIV